MDTKSLPLDRFALPALLLGATAIGLAPIFVRLSEIGPTATAFHRMFLSLPVLGIWFWINRRAQRDRAPVLNRSLWKWIVAAGLFFAADLAVWHWSITITSVANATLLANLAPVFVALTGWGMFGERYRSTFLIGLAVAFSGALVLMGNSLSFSPERVTGDILGVLTAIFYAGYIISVARLRAGVSTVTVMFASAAVSSLALLPIALLSGENLLPASTYGWTVLGALAVISHVGGQGLITYALAHLSAAFGSVGLLWQPVAAAILAWVILSEPLGVWQTAGGVIVLLGIYLARKASQRLKISEENIS